MGYQLLGVRVPLLDEVYVRPMALVGRIGVIQHQKANWPSLLSINLDAHNLSQASTNKLNRCPWNLAAFVEVDGTELQTEDLLSPLFVVQAADPDLRAVRKLKVPHLIVPLGYNTRETDLHDLR